MKRPPDKYSTLKIPLKNILNNPSYALLIPVSSVNKLVIHVYQFLRLWILTKLENNIVVPQITEKIIVMSFKVFLEQTHGGAPPLDDETYTNLQNFYNDEYKNLGYKLKKIVLPNVSSIIDYISTDILTNIENNIKFHYICHLKMYVNKYFTKEFENNEENKKLNSDEKSKLRKQMRAELTKVKNDLINNTMTSDNKYHKWIEKYRGELLPNKFGEKLVNDVMSNPQKYLKYMYKIAKYLGELGMKQIQFFPLRTNIYPKYITLDTKALIEIFIKENKRKYLHNVEEYKNEVWCKVFDLNNKIFEKKNHQFNYLILTDGYSTSIVFIHNDYVSEEEQKKRLQKEGKIVKKKLEEDVYKKLYEKIPENNKKSIMKALMYPRKAIEIKDISQYNIDDFDSNLIIKTNKFGKNPDEFQYFEDLTIEELKEISKEYTVREEPQKSKRKRQKKQKNKKKSNAEIMEKQMEKQMKKQKKKKDRKEKQKKIKTRDFIIEKRQGKNLLRKYKNRRTRSKRTKMKIKKMVVYIDPGMKNIYMMKGANGVYYRYSNSQRLRETKRLKYQKKLERKKIKKQITKTEAKMCDYKCKSCTVKEFKRYIKQKNTINEYLIQRL